MSIVTIALKNPYAVTVLALLFLVAGVVAIVQIPVDILPVFKSPGVMILTYYSGMPASSIERNITTRLERWCGQATGVIKVWSRRGSSGHCWRPVLPLSPPTEQLVFSARCLSPDQGSFSGTALGDGRSGLDGTVGSLTGTGTIWSRAHSDGAPKAV